MKRTIATALSVGLLLFAGIAAAQAPMTPTQRADATYAAALQSLGQTATPRYAAAQTAEASPPAAGFVGICAVGGVAQTCIDGAPWAVYGATTYHMVDAPKVDWEIARAKAMGLNALQLFGFYCNYAQPSDFTAPCVFSRMDYAIQQARANGLHVVLDFSDYGHLLHNGGSSEMTAASYAQWDEMLSTYANHVNGLTGTAYKDDPTVAFVEMYGEAPCPNCTGQAPLPTTAEMTAFYAHTLATWHTSAPNILGTSGNLNYLDWNGGVDYRAIFADPNNALCNAEIDNPAERATTGPLVRDYCASIGKPVINGGVVVGDAADAGGSDDAHRAAWVATMADYNANTLRGAGTLYWNLGDDDLAASPATYDFGGPSMPLTSAAVLKASCGATASCTGGATSTATPSPTATATSIPATATPVVATSTPAPTATASSITPTQTPAPLPSPTSIASTATPAASPTPTSVATTIPATATATIAPPTNLFYVSPTGSDAASGSPSAPWKTLNKAMATLTAGQTAIFADGTYIVTTQANTGHAGTAAAGIAIRAANNGKAKIMFTGMQGVWGKLHITQPYWTVDGFEITENAKGTDTNDVLLFADKNNNANPTHATIINNTAHGAYEKCFKFYGADNALVDGNTCYDIRDDGIDFVNTANVTVSNNELYHIGRTAMFFKEGSRNVRIFNNYYHEDGNYQSGYPDLPNGIELGDQGTADVAWNPSGYEGYNQVAFNNVIVSTNGVHIGYGLSFWGATDSAFFFNVVSGVRTGAMARQVPDKALGWSVDPKTNNARFEDNIITGCTAATEWNTGGMSGSFVSDYNDWYGNGGTPNEPHSKTTNPLLTADWHLGAGSPAKGGGVAVTINDLSGQPMDISHDRAGALRGNPPSMGIYA